MNVTHRNLAVGAATATALAYYWKLQQNNTRKVRVSQDGTVKKPKQNPMLQIFYLLWPFNKSAEDIASDPEARVGQKELIAIFMVSVLRTWHQNRMVYIKTDLMKATYKRDIPLFKRIIKETVILSVLSSIIFATHRYLKERLTLLWREKLTKLIHRKYFHAMNYYKISHLNSNKIPDVEERITKDPRRFCKGLADEMEKLSAAVTSGIWFTYKLTTISSLPYAISPLIYFYMAYKASMTLAPNWSKRWRKMLDLKGIYEKSQSRLQTHSEAICAYKGNDQERSIIESKWDAFLKYAHRFVSDASRFQFVTSAFFEYGGHSFGEALVVGKFISPDHPAKQLLLKSKNLSSEDRVAAIASLFAELRFLTEYFIRAMSAQGTIIQVLRQLQNMKGPAKRLTQLYDTLDDFNETRTQNTTFESSDDMIKFSNVQVYTPLGHLLVKDLNFEINHGTSLLLTGCNGSGKSSIFRCLGSLWNVPEPGVITKPGGNEPGLNKLVFYLPQKPYNVLGTLRSQLCYPETEENAAYMTKDELRALLELVDLGYLVDRDSAEERNWENELSLGEQQRLAMARLLHHSPKYAILDECTSGVSASMEKKLYEICKERNISCITISHRPVLEQYHDVVLNILADGKGGWTIRNTNRETLTAGGDLVGGYSKSYLEGLNSNSNGDSERQRLKDRSAKYKEALKSKVKRKVQNRSLLQKLRDIMKQFLPKGADLADPEFRRVLLMAALIISKTLLADAIAKYDGYILSTAMSSDYMIFTKAVVTGAFFRTFLAFFDAQLFKQKWALNIEWRTRLTTYLMNLYFTKNTFYDITNNDDRISDPEERFTEQVEQLSINLTELWTSLLKPAFDIGFNTVVLYRLLGTKGVLYTSGYMLGGLLLMRFAVPNFRSIQKKQFALEGRFRFVHTRLIEHTESIAFFGGDDVEHGVVNGRFDQVKKHISDAQLQTLRFNIFNNFTIKQTPDIVAFALRMLFAKGFSSDSDILAGHSGVDLSSQGEYIQQTVMRSFRSFGEAFDLQETIGNFIGTVDNVTELMYTLEDLSTISESDQSKQMLKNSADEGFDGIRFKDVDIVAPGGTCVASNMNLDIKRGESLVVTGPNASGKSSLFRVIGGLWAIPKGQISRPCTGENSTVSIRDVFLVPQKPYSVTGTLADQLSYPLKVGQESQQKLEDLLDLVGIKYLLTRYKLWETIMKWEDVLSLGEQQRLNCARLFFHDPTFAILDECTSAVSNDVEVKLYETAKQRGITSITISQRLALEDYHENELKMGDANGDDGWSISKLEKPSNPPPQSTSSVSKSQPVKNGNGSRSKAPKGQDANKSEEIVNNEDSPVDEKVPEVPSKSETLQESKTTEVPQNGGTGDVEESKENGSATATGEGEKIPKKRNRKKKGRGRGARGGGGRSST